MCRSRGTGLFSLLRLLAVFNVLGSSATSKIDRRQREGFEDTAFFYRNIQHARERVVTSTDINTWKSALASPNMTDTDRFQGFDITKPYSERSPIDGFTTLLRITADYPLPFGSTEESDDTFTTVTSVSITVPDEIAADNGTGLPENVDPSWNICNGYFYLTAKLNESNTNCGGVLSNDCIRDIESSLSEAFQTNDSCQFPDNLPSTCRFGELVQFFGWCPHLNSAESSGR